MLFRCTCTMGTGKAAVASLYGQKIETFVDLIYPGLSKTKRDKMKKGLKGKEGEITLNKSELP